MDIIENTNYNFAGFTLNRKSISGYVSFIRDNLVTWTKKQTMVSLSSV
jgi:hypothetical protein